MTEQRRIRVAVIYGGRSSEHEISLQSARSVLANLDRTRFEPCPIGVAPSGHWYHQDLTVLDAAPGPGLPIDTRTPALSVPPHPGGASLGDLSGQAIDVVFPIMHGPLCEDGSVQGLLDLMGLPYVGSDVLGSSVGMDKDVAKRLARDAGIACTPYLALRAGEWLGDRAPLRARVAQQCGYPCFVKPARLGSSIGMRRVAEPTALEDAVAHALEYDDKVLVERAVDAREIELAVLGPGDGSSAPSVSLPGEIVAGDAFYTFDRKYVEADGASLHVPAALTEAQTQEAQAIAARIFLALECDGMARVDLFLDRRSGALLFNEVNTIPGFTAISMYPKLWEASGLSYGALLTRLLELGLARGRRRAALKRSR